MPYRLKNINTPTFYILCAVGHIFRFTVDVFENAGQSLNLLRRIFIFSLSLFLQTNAHIETWKRQRGQFILNHCHLVFLYVSYLTTVSAQKINNFR
jgi:hypothetical protein